MEEQNASFFTSLIVGAIVIGAIVFVGLIPSPWLPIARWFLLIISLGIGVLGVKSFLETFSFELENIIFFILAITGLIIWRFSDLINQVKIGFLIPS